MTRHTWPRIALPVAMLAAVVAGSVLVPNPDAAWRSFHAHLSVWRQFVAENLLAAAVVYFLVYMAGSALSLPTAVPLSLVGGALFGRWLGAVLSVTAATAGGTIAFLASRYVFRDWVRARYGPGLQAVEAGFARDGAWYLLTLRLIPVVPYTLTNLAMGLTPMRVRTFAATSWIGMLPAGLVLANAGATASGVRSLKEVLSVEVLGALALLGVLPLAARWVARQVARVRRAGESPTVTNRSPT